LSDNKAKKKIDLILDKHPEHTKRLEWFKNQNLVMWNKKFVRLIEKLALSTELCLTSEEKIMNERMKNE